MAPAKPTKKLPPPKLFRNAAAWRAWLEKNHAERSEIWLKYYKKGSGKKSVSYPEALDEALCFGWIDGIVRSIDDETYMQRWTPRKKRSNWSAVNVKKVETLIASGRMRPSGLAAYEARDKGASALYSFENSSQELPPEAEGALRRNEVAWSFWQAQSRSYRRSATWHVVSAKREETRERRIAQLVACSARRKRLPQFSPEPRAKQVVKRSTKRPSKKRSTTPER